MVWISSHVKGTLKNFQLNKFPCENFLEIVAYVILMYFSHTAGILKPATTVSQLDVRPFKGTIFAILKHCNE